MCDKLPSIPVSQRNQKNGVIIYTDNVIRVSLLTPNMTLDDFKGWLSANPITVLYRLAEPIETPISETELNAYRHLLTNKGNTTIISEADMEVDYYINKPNAQAIGNIHSQVNADYLKLQQAIISTGGNV
jgi:hypothetical protein